MNVRSGKVQWRQSPTRSPACSRSNPQSPIPNPFPSHFDRADPGSGGGEGESQCDISQVVGEAQGPEQGERRRHKERQPALDGIAQGQGHRRQQGRDGRQRDRVVQQPAGVEQTFPEVSALVNVAEEKGGGRRFVAVVNGQEFADVPGGDQDDEQDEDDGNLTVDGKPPQSCWGDGWLETASLGARPTSDHAKIG